MTKVKTIDLKGKQYAQVKDRLKAFREQNPRAKIETIPLMQEDGQILFKATILADKADEFSPEATGHALGKNGGVKAFEKLETIAVGRALSLMGYAGDGEIASSEEMEEFEQYKQDQISERADLYAEQLKKAKTIQDLQKVWGEIDGECKPLLEELKNELKNKLNESK